jgi:hypothetical protein
MSLFHASWSGWFMGYLNVTAPMVAGAIRARTGSELKLPRLLALGVPATLVAGMANTVARPFLHGLGVVGGSFLDWTLGMGLAAAVGYVAGQRQARPPAPSSAHRRGTLVNEGPQVEAPSREGVVTLAGQPVALLDETKHFKLIGTTGTGKSTAIGELLGGALARGDRAIIADPDGGYLARFGNKERGDVILNPFDARSRRWDLFGEIEQPYDVELLARSLIPDHGRADPAWTGYARTFFSAVTRQTHEIGTKDMQELYRLIMVADTDELRTLVAGTPAQPFLNEHNVRMFDSLRSVAGSALGPLEHIVGQTAEPLSIRKWVRDPESRGVLFMPYQATQIAALRSTVSAWMRLAISEAMSRPEGDQRLWFVVDELDALGAIDGLKDALARLRKFGGRCVLGFQSVAQVSGTYGQDDARTIIENCGNTLILRCSGSDHGGTTHFASKLIGQREVTRKSTSKSWRPTDLLASRTVSEHISVEPAIMDSQIEQLPDLTGYLKFASLPTWQRVTLVMPKTPDGTSRSASTGDAANREGFTQGAEVGHRTVVGHSRNEGLGLVVAAVHDRMTATATAVAAAAKAAWSQWRASNSESRQRSTPSPQPTPNPDASPRSTGKSAPARDGADTAL